MLVPSGVRSRTTTTPESGELEFPLPVAKGEPLRRKSKTAAMSSGVTLSGLGLMDARAFHRGLLASEGVVPPPDGAGVTSSTSTSGCSISSTSTSDSVSISESPGVVVATVPWSVVVAAEVFSVGDDVVVWDVVGCDVVWL